MGFLVKPNIKVDKIELKTDENSKVGIANLLKSWGPAMPVVKINNYVLAAGEVESFDLNVKLNALPSFTFSINDSNYAIRRALQKETIDKCVIFIGFSNWYIKFNGLITSCTSDAGATNIFINGILFNEKLYTSIQKSYKDLTINDILTDIAQKTNMGLFTVNNKALSNTLDYCLNSNKKYIDFFKYVIEKYTNNLWSIDPLYNFYVSDIETLRKQKFDKYTIGESGKQHDPKDMIITSYWFNETDNFKLKANYYSINTNFGIAHINNSIDYGIFSSDSKEASKIDSNKIIGLGDDFENTFSGFKKQFFPYYDKIVNKSIAGKSITVEMEQVLFELTPFSVVDFEVYFPKKDDEPVKKDIENSGKKVVIGYSYHFDKKNEENTYPKVRQSIDLI